MHTLSKHYTNATAYNTLYKAEYAHKTRQQAFNRNIIASFTDTYTPTLNPRFSRTPLSVDIEKHPKGKTLQLIPDRSLRSRNVQRYILVSNALTKTKLMPWWLQPQAQRVGKIVLPLVQLEGGIVSGIQNITAYAGKNNDFVWLQTPKHHILIGNNGQFSVKNIPFSVDLRDRKQSLIPDTIVSKQALKPEAQALQAARLNERPPSTQSYVKTMYIPAGGAGERLEPLLAAAGGAYKPNTFLGNKTILHNLIEHYHHFGINRFIIAVNQTQKAAFEKNLSDFPSDVEIQYICEKEKMGTAGALINVLEHPEIYHISSNELIMVAMGDAVIKSNLDITQLIKQHQSTHADITLAVAPVGRELMHKFGMVITDNNHQIKAFKEKPASWWQKRAIGNTGLASLAIYLLSPNAIHRLQERYDEAKHGKWEAESKSLDFACNLLEMETQEAFNGKPTHTGRQHKLKLYAYPYTIDQWVDIGDLNTFRQTALRIANGEIYGVKATQVMRQQVGVHGELYYQNSKSSFNQEMRDLGIEPDMAGNVVVVPKPQESSESV